MLARLDLAVTKGCDGVDPDSVDGYDNENCHGLTQADAVDYMNVLADAAHSRTLAVELKDAGEIITHVLGKMQWAVNEQCVQYGGCDTWQPFVQTGKPVFHFDYPDGAPNVASQMVDSTSGDNDAFETVLKEMDCGDWVDTCSYD